MSNKIKIGKKVRFKLNGKFYNRTFNYLNGQPVRRVVSPESPVGQAIFDKTAGTKLVVNTPGGPAKVEILEVS